MVRLPFQDRAEAGSLLGAYLVSATILTQAQEKPVVLGLARGGLPVAAEVAHALDGSLDVLVVRKLGVPFQPELAMGAIAGHTVYLDAEMIRWTDVSREQVDAVAAREKRELERREHLYRRGHPPVEARGRDVVLVDDGLATGSTMVAAVRHVQSLQPASLIVAVPVGSTEACRRIEREAGQCICLAEPDPFDAVGRWYVDFGQVSDEEVQEILDGGRRVGNAGDGKLVL